MTALSSMATESGGSALRRIWTNENLRRGVACEGGAIVLAVMTGPEGSGTAPTSGITGSLGNPRIFWFIGIGLVLWAIWTTRTQFAPQITRAGDRVTALPRRLLPDKRVRSVLYLALLGVAIWYPTVLNGFWQEVLVDQIGVYVLLALGLNIVVGSPDYSISGTSPFTPSARTLRRIGPVCSRCTPSFISTRSSPFHLPFLPPCSPGSCSAHRRFVYEAITWQSSHWVR